MPNLSNTSSENTTQTHGNLSDSLTASTGSTTYDMRESSKLKKVAPIALQDKNDIGMAAHIDVSDRNTLFSGNPELENIMQGMHKWLCGEKTIGHAGFVSRFGVYTKLFRSCPPPIIWDNPALIPLLGENACEDTAGRTWFYAPFYKKCLDDQSKGLEILAPLHFHEKGHTLLKHVHRMRNVPGFIRNKASHMPLNPMIAALFPSGTNFSPIFAESEGIRKEDARFKNLSEETCAQILLSEFLEKGTIEIDTLILIDGKVEDQKIISPKTDETLSLGNLTITVQNKGTSDLLDTILDCGLLKVNRVVNNLKPRVRSGLTTSAPPPTDTPIQIPCVTPNQLLNDLIENPFNSASPDGASGHIVDIKEIGAALKQAGMSHIAKSLEINDHNAKRVERVVEKAISDSEKERRLVGSDYPGAHINDYITEVVKPKFQVHTTWDNMILEKIQGAGRKTERSMDELGYLNYVSPEDMGMTEDDQVFYAGDLQIQSKERFLFLIDSSGSVDQERAAMYVSCAISVRQNRGECDPEVHIACADTALRGEPTDLTDDEIAQILESGFGMNGRGGTDIVGPLSQVMNHAKENGITYCGIAYLTDLGVPHFTIDDLPEGVPPIVFICTPRDHSENSDTIEMLKKVGEVAVIEKQLHLSFAAAEEKLADRTNKKSMRP